MTGLFDDLARAAAVAVARERIEPGMTIGLGSGRAVFALVDLLATTWPGLGPCGGDRLLQDRGQSQGGRDRAGRPERRPPLDLAVDGADEIDSRFSAQGRRRRPPPREAGHRRRPSCAW